MSDANAVAAALCDLREGEAVAVTLESGRKLMGIVEDYWRDPATHDAGDGFPMAGDLSVGIAIDTEDVRRADLPAEELRITATERRVGRWETPTAAVPHYAGDRDDPELRFLDLGAVVAVEIVDVALDADPDECPTIIEAGDDAEVL